MFAFGGQAVQLEIQVCSYSLNYDYNLVFMRIVSTKYKKLVYSLKFWSHNLTS